MGKETREKKVSLHEKSDKPNSGKKKSLAASFPGPFHGRSVTPNYGEKEIKKKNEPSTMKREKKKQT